MGLLQERKSVTVTATTEIASMQYADGQTLHHWCFILEKVCGEIRENESYLEVAH